MAALTLAIPSKGRLKENCNAWFAERGVSLEQTAGARGYRASFTGALPDWEVMLLSAGEIAAALLAGDIHLGITGEDLLREEAPELASRMQPDQAAGLRFSPMSWWRYRGTGLDVATMADLDDVCLRRLCPHAIAAACRWRPNIAQLTRSCFAQARISDYRIVPSAGATEGAPAPRTAEVIVDITTTGATLRDNGLKLLEDGVILKSQAQLAADKVSVMRATLLPVHRILTIAVLTSLPLTAWAAIGTARGPSDSVHYRSCLSASSLNPGVALTDAEAWAKSGGGVPAQHCAALALVSLKHYAEAGTRLDHLAAERGVPDMSFRAALYDQAGNAWLLAWAMAPMRCKASRRRWHCRPATPISSPTWPAPCAMRHDWHEVDLDLNAALQLSPRRADLLVLRASARRALVQYAEANADIEAGAAACGAWAMAMRWWSAVFFASSWAI